MRVLMGTIMAISIGYLLVYLWMVYHRMPYPFDLEWIEGGMVDVVQRILHGRSIYVAPSVDYVPFLYPPVFFYLSAAVATLTGPGLLPLRLVSFLASLVSCGVIYAIVLGETKSKRIALLSAAAYIAAFRVSGAWMDIARVDSLFIAFYLLFLWIVLRRRRTTLMGILAGIVAAVAMLTKQSAIVACAPVVAYLLVRNWKYGLAMVLSAGALLAAITIVFQSTSGGWFTFYVYDLMKQQTEWQYSMFVRFWTDDLIGHLPVASLFGFVLLAGKLRRDRSGFQLWMAIALGAVAASFLTRAKAGGYDNVMLPVYAIAAVFLGAGLRESLDLLQHVALEHRTKAALLVPMAYLIQLTLFSFNPMDQIPTETDRAAGLKLLTEISLVPGDVWLPDHGYLASRAGKSTRAHHSAIWDIIRGEQKTRGKTILKRNLDHTVRNQVFERIILDGDWNFISPDIYTSYDRGKDFFGDPTGFYMVTGWKRRPTEVYIPRR